MNDPYFDVEEAVADLLKEGWLVCVTRTYWCDFYKKNMGPTISLFLNCNDVFGPGSDAECITTNEIEELYTLHKTIPNNNGILIWICRKRNKQPWSYFKNRLWEKGDWCDELEQLPENKN